MYHSPAEVLAQCLVNKGVGSLMEIQPDAEWVVTSMNKAPLDRNMVAVFDTSGVDEGRIMKTSERVQKPGIEVMVKCRDKRDGWVKINSVAITLDSLLRESVALEGRSYYIQAVKRVGTPIYVGNEQSSPFSLFSLNALITVKEL